MSTPPDRATQGGALSPASERNAGPILEVLREVLPVSGQLLEIAAGSGYHAGRFAGALPGLDWQPTDLNPGNFAAIREWSARSTGRIRPPLQLDATRPGWSSGFHGYDAVLLVNLLHLIPSPGAEVLLRGLAEVLAPGGIALLYGPFLRDGLATSPGDAAFDESLRARDPAIGYKDLAWVEGHLSAAGFQVARREMPANNLMLIARI